MMPSARRRLFWYQLLGGLAFLLVGLRLLWVPVALARPVYPDQALATERVVLSPPRGQIFDRHGHLLAGNRKGYEIGIDLADVRAAGSLDDLLGFLSRYVAVDASAVRLLAASPEARYVPVAHNVPLATYEQMLAEMKAARERRRQGDLSAPNLYGLLTEETLHRWYPEGALASNVLGFFGGNRRGNFGVEEYYEELLRGRSVVVDVSTDPRQADTLPDPPVAADLVLTIHRALQAAVEAIAEQQRELTGAYAVTILVLNPRNGEILAMTSTPRLDLNAYWRMSEVFHDRDFFNRAVMQPYEPGSVFKVLTMAAALDSGAVTPETTFLDTGEFVVGGEPIHNWDGGAWGEQDMTGCLAHSLNTCLAWVATQTGASTFYRYLDAFGIGRQTGVDLAREHTGIVRRPGDGDWREVDLGRNAYGHGVAVTPLQLATAISAVANDGRMMVPHITRAVVSHGEVYPTPVRVLAQPIRPDTAHTLNEMLATALETESSLALVPGYRIAGKTGTANLPEFNYQPGITNASFVGWGPVDDPQFLVYVWLERPSTDIWGSTVAAPVFRQVVERLVTILGIPPDDVRRALREQ